MYKQKQRKSMEKEDPFITRSSSLTLSEKLVKDGYRDTIDKSKWITRNGFRGHIGVATTG